MKRKHMIQARNISVRSGTFGVWVRNWYIPTPNIEHTSEKSAEGKKTLLVHHIRAPDYNQSGIKWP